MGAVPLFPFTFRKAMKPRGRAKTWKVLLSNCAQSLLAGLAAFGFCAILIWVTTSNIIDPSGDTVSPSEVTSPGPDLPDMVSLTCLIGQDRGTYRGATHANISLITRWNIKSSLPTPRRHHKMIRHINRKLTAACCSVAVLLLLLLAVLHYAGNKHIGMMAPAVTMFTKLLPLLNAGAKPSELRCGVSLLIMLVCFGASAILKWFRLFCRRVLLAGPHASTTRLC